MYCPGSNIELLSAFLVVAVCQDSKVLRVCHMIICPCMFCHIRSLFAMFYIFQMLRFPSLEGSACFADVTLRTFFAWNFVNYVCLFVHVRSIFQGPETRAVGFSKVC